MVNIIFFKNDKPFSQSYNELAKKWSILPMYKNKKSVKQFFNLLNDCQVLFLYICNRDHFLANSLYD
ncbi:MAG: hypothetical protein ACKPKO_29125 [Candidatus Fonsibacter sp.]